MVFIPRKLGDGDGIFWYLLVNIMVFTLHQTSPWKKDQHGPCVGIFRHQRRPHFILSPGVEHGHRPMRKSPPAAIQIVWSVVGELSLWVGMFVGVLYHHYHGYIHRWYIYIYTYVLWWSLYGVYPQMVYTYIKKIDGLYMVYIHRWYIISTDNRVYHQYHNISTETMTWLTVKNPCPFQQSIQHGCWKCCDSIPT